MTSSVTALSSSRNHASRSVAGLWFVVASVALHGVALLVLSVSGDALPRLGLAGRVVRDTAEASIEAARRPAPLPSCEADEALATAAQVLLCATPLAGPGCTRRALDDFAAGRVRCHRVEVPAAVALIDAPRIDEIEPEPLTALLSPEEIQALQEALKQPPEQAPAPIPEQAPEQAPAPPPEQAPPPPPPPPPTTVVEVTRPETEEAPDNARFLSEYDTRVDKETVARGSTEQMVERPGPRQLRPTEQPREASIQELPEEPAPAASEQPDAPVEPGKLDMRAPGLPEVATVPREAMEPGERMGSEEAPTEGGVVPRKGEGAQREAARAASEARAGEGGGEGGRPLLPNLRPTEEVLERAVGGGSVDMVEGVEEGEITALNSKQWKFATFFNRLKRQVAQSWDPSAVIMRRDPTGRVYGSENRVTYLQVTLDRSGAVLAIHVVKSSGVDELDSEAVRAIRAAQPFPNPPGGLVDERSGQIVFPFGFHVQMGGRNNWRIFRYK